MTIQQAKQIDMVDYLYCIGHNPAKIKGHNYWYYSPFHEEKVPSFKVNKKINRWYDFSEGKGGNLVDFGVYYCHCSISDFLSQINSLPVNTSQPCPAIGMLSNLDSKIRIVSVNTFKSYALKEYLQLRKIVPVVSHLYCSEVSYQISDRLYYAVGFKNNSGGYELRSRNFKGSSSPKDISFIDNGAKELAVFEGFFDFLSFLSYYHASMGQLLNYLVLNSTSFFEKSISLMARHQQIYLYLDNDNSGQKFTDTALAINKQKFRDNRYLYRGYKDLNEWLVKGRPLK